MATEPEEMIDPRLAEAVGRLSDREPENDLWQGIAPRLQRRRPGLLLSWPAAAAAAIALIAATAVVTSQLTRPPVVQPEVAATTTVPSGALQLVAANFGAAEASLEAGCADLEEAFLRIAPDLDPELRAAVTASLATLDSAVTQAQSQARAQPENLDAARYLTHALQRKLNVLRTVTNLTTARSS